MTRRRLLNTVAFYQGMFAPKREPRSVIAVDVAQCGAEPIIVSVTKDANGVVRVSPPTKPTGWGAS